MRRTTGRKRGTRSKRHIERVAEAATVRTAYVHGHEVAYRALGEGPVVVLVHGIAGSSTTWVPVMPLLGEDYTVIAPDLLGHGESAKPRGDYSLGAYASGIRDLLTVLGHERATFVGHSLGGGIAMQLAYQFPHMCERLALVATGGFGKEVNPLLRAISLPGSEYVLPVVLTRHVHGLASTVGRVFGSLGLRGDALLTEVWAAYTTLTDARAQRAFVHTIRSVIDVAGQRVSARDRLYLAQEVPTLIVWGDRDAVIPVEHGYAAHELLPASRLEIVEGAGHFLPFEQPQLLDALLRDFLASTEPASVTAERWSQVLAAHAVEG
ncbi:MAG TPA: alpha/beta fold hydrolase [Acidimicrobiales bacterium]|nr:alpha/beta fold hydrolase [Acidimicrobiales bacterium]